LQAPDEAATQALPTSSPQNFETPTGIPSPADPGISPTAEEASPAPAEAPAATTAPAAQSVQSLPAVGSAVWTPVASGLELPIGLASPLDGSGRLFVIEQAGHIHAIQDSVLQQEPFLDISANVGCCGERGLLGLAFHPRYTENGYFYVNYTDRASHSIVARYQVSEDDPNRAQPSSELRLLVIDQPYPNHNGGSVVFGPDGYLYLGFGDGGSGGDPHGNGQSTTTLLGKILRLDVDSGEPYAIPSDNPLANGGGQPEIWATGLRNPWRFAFDPLTDDLYIADVGQNAWEEVNFLPAGSPGGANFGWNYREGSHSYTGRPPGGLALIDPVAEYGHNQGCSVTGGEVYRGARLPQWQGVYLYGDYCSGLVWGLLRTPDGAWQEDLLFETGGNVSSFGLDEAGEVYLADYNGTVSRLDPAP